MDHENNTYRGTVLRPDQFALVADMDGSIVLYMPNLPACTSAPRSVQLLTAIAAKIDDEDWDDDMIRGLEDYR
jgi:hypothetical protein